MKVHHILAEVDYAVVGAGSGRNRVFNIIDPTTGAVVGKERIRGQADAKAKNLTAKSTTAVGNGGAVPPADSYGRVNPSLNKNKLGGVTKATAGIGYDAAKKDALDIAGTKFKKLKSLKKLLFNSRTGSGLLSAFISAEKISRWMDEYTDIIILCVNEGKSPNSDPRLANVRIKITEEMIASFIAIGVTIAKGGSIVKWLRSLTILGAALPGAGWIGAAVTGALWLGTGVAVSVASEILVSRKFMEPVVDWFMEDWFEANVIDGLSREYARFIGKAVPKAESRIVNSKVIRETENAASISSAAKELVSGSSLIQQALKKAKEQGINKNNAADKLARAIEGKATT